MALMFSRLAHNFIKNGYFPTDERTLEAILGALQCDAPAVRIWDPCCGEGTALAEVKAHLQEQGAAVSAFGVEFDSERAWHSKQLLDSAIHSDVHDVVVSPRSMSLLFLNPPYGVGVANQASTGDGEASERLEMAFLRKAVPTLINGGVLVFIVPHYVVDKEMTAFLCRHFKSIQAYMAPEPRFRQCVIFGVKCKVRSPDKRDLALLDSLRAGELADSVLDTQTWNGSPYLVPAAPEEGELRFHAVRIDPAQLQAEVARFRASTLWPSFMKYFSADVGQHRRPARDMTKWHLALALAAGQVSGRVESAGGRVLLIKGDTFKRKERSTVVETNADGDISEVVTLTDKFVPVINAIEFTPGPNLGRIVTIR